MGTNDIQKLTAVVNTAKWVESTEALGVVVTSLGVEAYRQMMKRAGEEINGEVEKSLKALVEVQTRNLLGATLLVKAVTEEVDHRLGLDGLEDIQP